jgi:hypothetical protein
LKKILDAGGPGTKPKPKPRKKRVSGKKGPTVPEEIMEPENPVPDVTAATSAGIVPAPEEKFPVSTSTSPERSLEEKDSPISG